MRILAISGSLRSASLNTALLRACTRLAPPTIQITLFRDLGELPLFNPDIEATNPDSVGQLRRQIISSDALLMASPEYAHGITGAMKNALDWMVGYEALVNKPVAILSASPRAVHADAQLREVITTMSARVIQAASISVPVLGSQLNEDGIVSDPTISKLLVASLGILLSSLTLTSDPHQIGVKK